MIAHVVYSGVGGTGSFVLDLCPRLDKHNGEESQVIFYGVEPLHSDYSGRLASAGIRYSRVTKKPGLDLSSVHSLAREIRRLKTNVVVMHGGGEAWHWPLLRLMGVRSRLVLVEHGPEISWSYTRRVISILCAHTIIAISEPLAASLRARFGMFLRSRTIRTIPNGIDTEFFSPNESPRSRDLILHVATLSRVKDQATLIRACALISRRREIRLILAGDGVTRPQLEQLAAESGIRDCVTFLGNVGRDRLLELYRQAAVFVLSTRGEGLSLALLEAMACACPIVASDVPGVTEVLAGTEAGVLVSQGHDSEMAEAIGQLLEHPELGARMGNAARQCVLRDYSSGRMAARYRDTLIRFDGCLKESTL